MRRAVCLAVLLIATGLAGCAGPSPRSNGPAAARPASRVVALVPSLGGDLFAIGAGPAVVGVSAYTDVTASPALPRVSDSSSVDAEKIVALRPDLVVGIPAQARQVESLQRAGVRVVLMRDDRYEDIFANLAELGALTGRSPQAAATIARLRAQTAELQARTRSFKRKPSVFVAFGTGPIWTAGSGSYIATLIALAGGRNAADDLHQAWGEYGAESLLRAQPDVIVSDPSVHLESALGREPWRSLRAVREGRVYVVEPASILEQPGTHYTEGLQWLIDRLVPLAS